MSVRVTYDEYLRRCFLGQIVLRIPSPTSSSSYTVINIEINDNNTDSETEKKFLRVRDMYLTSVGIAVVRIDSRTFYNMSEIDKKNWIIDIIAGVNKVEVAI